MNKGCMAAVVAALAGCVTSEYTGRRQLMLVDARTEAALGRQAYQQVLAEQPISEDPEEVGPVRRVGERIARAAAQPEFQWEFNVIADPKVRNAWCLPGGKIAFYTGIFPVLQDEAGMAFVMGHEVAHALLHHGAERMSQNLTAAAAGTLLDAYLGVRHSRYQQAVMAAFGVATQVGVLLPYSRTHESEADALGLQLMARAGYDPRVSVEVWKRMAQAGGAQPPEFLSTHPSHETRIEDLRKDMDQAVALYEQAAPAPVARLPRARGSSSPGTAAAAALSLSPAGHRPTTLDDGRPALLLGIRFPQDVFVETIEVTGPGGHRSRMRADAGVPAGQVRHLAVPSRVPGKYVAVVRGRASGRPFESTCAHEVP